MPAVIFQSQVGNIVSFLLDKFALKGSKQ